MPSSFKCALPPPSIVAMSRGHAPPPPPSTFGGHSQSPLVVVLLLLSPPIPCTLPSNWNLKPLLSSTLNSLQWGENGSGREEMEWKKEGYFRCKEKRRRESEKCAKRSWDELTELRLGIRLALAQQPQPSMC